MSDYHKIFTSVLDLESQALLEAKQWITEEQINLLIEIFQHLNSSSGQLICVGVGKSGAIAKKVASTFSSLGVNSFFLHPVEALHGDMGRVSDDDVLILISKSGTTEEIVKFLPYVGIVKERIIGLLGNQNSVLGKKCGLNFNCTVKKEACINNQAPTTSTTLALAMGDAMSVVYEKWVGLTKEGFALNHPAGALGKSLRLKVVDLMQVAEVCPIVSMSATLKDVVLVMSQFPLGACAIVDNGELKGLIVEGDFRRNLNQKNVSLNSPVADIMNNLPMSISPQELAYDALLKMEDKDRQIYVLPVVEDKTFMGFIRMHDIMREGLYADTK